MSLRIHGLNRKHLKIFGKNVVADVYSVVRPMMVVSVVNMYRFFLVIIP